MLVGREAEGGEHAGQQAAVVDPDGGVGQPERVDRREGRDEQLGLGLDAGLADDVDVALHELAEAALLRALGAPHRRDLDRAEHRRQLGAVAGVEPGERHGQVEAQPEVDEVEGLLGGGEISSRRQSALEHAEGELLVVAAEPRVQALAVLHDRRLDLVETVGPVALPDDAEHALAPLLLGGEEVAHAARGIYGSCHGAIVSAG